LRIVVLMQSSSSFQLSPRGRRAAAPVLSPCCVHSTTAPAARPNLFAVRACPAEMTTPANPGAADWPAPKN